MATPNVVTANTEPRLYNLELGRMNITVVGITSLITNRFSPEVQKGIEDGQQGAAKRGKKPKDPQAIFQRAIHRTDDGQPGVLAVAFKKAIVRAAKSCDIPMTDARGYFQVLGTILPIRGSEPVMRADRVRLRGGALDIAYRPGYEKWEVDLEIVFNARTTSAEQLLNLVEVAGFGVGVGCWRPETDGNHGMFMVKR